MKMKTTSLLIVAATALVLTSCRKNAAVQSTTSEKGPSAALAAVLAAPPAGEAKSIHLVRSSVKPGDVITLSGRIMGNAKPFVEGRAVFILGDPATLTACNDTPGDTCETPWDVCCETPEEKKNGTATIQIVDADGRVLKESVEGVGGIEKLAHVTVTGKVAEGSSPDLLIVNAQAIRSGD
jgi:hypothetical protein